MMPFSARAPGMVCLLGAAAALAFWNWFFGFWQFGGDGSVILNTGWLQYTGQAAYRDFKTGCPPLFVFPLGWAFRLGGVSWSSVVALITLFSSLLFFWQVAVLRRGGFPLTYSILVVLALQSMTILTSSWWWYNPVTSSVESLLLASVFFLVLRPEDKLLRISVGAAAFLVSLAKVNTAAPLLAGLFLLLVYRRDTRGFALLTTLSIAVLGFILFLVQGTTPLLYLQNLHEVSARVFSPRMWWLLLQGVSASDSTLVIAVVVLLALCLPEAIRARVAPDPQGGLKTRRSMLYLFLLALGLFWIGGVTNNDLKCTDAAALATVTLCVAGLHPTTLSRKARYINITIFLLLGGLTLNELMLAWVRQRILNQGTGQFFEVRPLDRLEGPPCLRGIMTGRSMFEMIREVTFVVSNDPALQGPDKKVYIGFRIDGMYPALGLKEPRGLPLWWENVPSTHAGDGYSSHSRLPDFSEQPGRWLQPGEPPDSRVRAFLNAHFDVCIFWRGYLHRADMAFMPGDLRAELHDHYKLDDHFPEIVVYRRSTP